MADFSATDVIVNHWLAMAQDQTLPPFGESWYQWGEEGLITEVEANAAVEEGNFYVFPAGGLQTQQDQDNWLAGVLNGMDLQFVPD